MFIHTRSSWKDWTWDSWIPSVISAEDKLEMRLSMKDLQSILFSNRENLRYIKREPQVSQECYISWNTDNLNWKKEMNFKKSCCTFKLHRQEIFNWISNPCVQYEILKSIPILNLSWIKFQNIKLTHRNPLHFYTLTMRKQKEKLRKQFHFQAPLSMAFPRHEYWREFPFPFPGGLPYPGIKSTSPAWQVDSLTLSHLAANRV